MLSLNLEDFRIALRDLSGILRIVSFVMLLPIPVALYFAEFLDLPYLLKKISVFLIPSAILYILYFILEKKFRSELKTRTKHAMLTVALAWLIVTILGSLPYILSNTLNPLDSFFESMSGWTTTGMTMLRSIENTEKEILFYRGLTQWVGGVGIIVLALVVFMRKGTVAIQYYASEVGGLKLKPSIKSTVIETWKIYGIYTLACIILLYLAGMTPFDSILHSFSTLSTGGFTTHSNSIGYYDSPLIELILMVFMLIGAIGFLIHFKLFNGQYTALIENIEFRYMLKIILISIILISMAIWSNFHYSLFNAVRIGSFQAVSGMTCTGFSTVDLSKWHDLPITVLILLMYVGGLYGSTAGGIKLLRFIIILRVIVYNLKRLILPKSAVFRIKLDEKVVGDEQILYALGLSSAYIVVAVIGAIIMMLAGYSWIVSLFLTLSAMGNVGLINIAGNSWFMMPSIGKLTLIFLMWIGRLEVFPVLILFSSIRLKRR